MDIWIIYISQMWTIIIMKFFLISALNGRPVVQLSFAHFNDQSVLISFIMNIIHSTITLMSIEYMNIDQEMLIDPPLHLSLFYCSFIAY